MIEEAASTDDSLEEIDDSMAGDIAAAMAAANEDIEDVSQSTTEQVEEVADSPEPLEASQEETPPSEPEQDDNGQDVDLDAPPNSLPPAAREAWKDAPEAIKEAVAKREQDYERGIMKYSADAKRATQMDEALRPFESYLSVNGGAAHIGDLLRTGASLQMGTQEQKVAQIADMITRYGIDIPALDNHLSGQAPAPQNDPIQQQIQAALAPIQQSLQTFQQREQMAEQQTQQTIQSEIEQFKSNPANEFYNDVRGDMADIMDMAAKHGRDLTLEQAYDRACKLNPQISDVLIARQSANSLSAKRNAASSVTGSRGGVLSQSSDGSIRGAIEHAFDNVGKV